MRRGTLFATIIYILLTRSIFKMLKIIKNIEEKLCLISMYTEKI